jgi:hypothetical protein
MPSDVFIIIFLHSYPECMYMAWIKNSMHELSHTSSNPKEGRKRVEEGCV